MVYDPATGRTRVYPIPVPHQGIISVTPDESRGVAYISTCSDERPVESAHFLILDLATGKYRDLMDTHHMYAFIVVDHLGRAYHPILGGEVARYDPRTDTLTRLKQTIDGRPPTADSLLAHPESHPINWEVSPDRKTLYAVAMSGNQLYAYDLTAEGDVLPGRRLGPLSAGAKATDCRAMCVGPDGTVWAGVAVTTAKGGQLLHVVRYRPGDPAPVDLGPGRHRQPRLHDVRRRRGQAEAAPPRRLPPEGRDARPPLRDHGHLRRDRRHRLPDDALSLHGPRHPRAQGRRGRDDLLPQLARRHDRRPPAPDRYPRRQGAPALGRAGLAVHRPGARDRHRPGPGARAGRPGL